MSTTKLVGNAVLRRFHQPFVDDRDAACVGALGGFVAAVVFLSICSCLPCRVCLWCECDGLGDFYGVPQSVPGVLMSGLVGYTILGHAVPVPIPANYDVSRASISPVVGTLVLTLALVLASVIIAVIYRVTCYTADGSHDNDENIAMNKV
ncbi:hypothetical protein BD410DRAFT_833244 [Rickenella mellea]|uniref:Uncharacterized protein n=1 Tax=Rickenella mellea TaxID=50990 RepID=A0A4Y7PFG3_9AGAM|nr:hypothetical protein BD410DRAFT_833244 [Rickenella mellea]